MLDTLAKYLVEIIDDWYLNSFIRNDTYIFIIMNDIFNIYLMYENFT